MKTILIMLCTFMLFSKCLYAAVDVGEDWLFGGDSQTDDAAADSPRWIDMVAPVTSPTSYINVGQSASELYYLIGRYEGSTGIADLTWVHFQESGGQGSSTQDTVEEFGDVFDDMVQSILDNSPDAIISYETAFSFGREDETGRDWGPYNTELRSRIEDWATAGTTIYLAETDANIKALQTAIGSPDDVWCQAGTGCDYHYRDLGNLMVAFSVWAALGYTRSEMVLTDSEITDLVDSEVEAALNVAFGAPAQHYSRQ